MEERYISVEQSIMSSCREINSMKAGLTAKRNWRDAFSKLKNELREDLAEENFLNHKTSMSSQKVATK